MHKIQPELVNVGSATIRKTLRVSRWYANHIRRGYVPHPRHWRVLARLVNAERIESNPD